MSKQLPNAERLKNNFIAYPYRWAVVLLLTWMLLNTLVLATTDLMEAKRVGRELSAWEPFCWELSSIALIVLAVWPIARIDEKLKAKLPLLGVCAAHAALVIPFSVIHVAGMVWLRKLCYWLVGWEYTFGNVVYEFLYELRKDAMTYITILIVINCFQFIVRRLQGEASYVQESETSTKPIPDRLLVKKLGKEFLIAVADIDWVEASGNYANLHVKNSVYPMRITMTKLERLLPEGVFSRVHRSAIVNINRVTHLQPLDSGDYTIYLAGGAEVSLSRRYRDNFRATSATATG